MVNVSIKSASFLKALGWKTKPIKIFEEKVFFIFLRVYKVRIKKKTLA